MIRGLMNKIRKVVMPAAGPRIVLALALPIIHSAAHAVALTGRAVFKGLKKGGSQ